MISYTNQPRAIVRVKQRKQRIAVQNDENDFIIDQRRRNSFNDFKDEYADLKHPSKKISGAIEGHLGGLFYSGQSSTLNDEMYLIAERDCLDQFDLLMTDFTLIKLEDDSEIKSLQEEKPEDVQADEENPDDGQNNSQILLEEKSIIEFRSDSIESDQESSEPYCESGVWNESDDWITDVSKILRNNKISKSTIKSHKQRLRRVQKDKSTTPMLLEKSKKIQKKFTFRY